MRASCTWQVSARVTRALQASVLLLLPCKVLSAHALLNGLPPNTVSGKPAQAFHGDAPLPSTAKALAPAAIGGASSSSLQLSKAAQPQIVVIENVKYDYAQVSDVEPVYETLRATRTEQQCDESHDIQPISSVEEGRISRMMNSVKGLLGSHSTSQQSDAPPPASPANCRIIEVTREFKRPIAYDVDYVYKGTRYRSRLPDDPGNKLPIRVSVTPYIPNAVIESTH